MKKLSLVITGASSTPQIAELETYAGSTSTPNPTQSPGPTQTPDPTQSPEPTGEPQPSAGTLYVSPNGSASAAGTISSPTTLASAISRVASGGEIFLRGGTYNLSETVLIAPGNDGTSGNRTLLAAYPGETPVLDFSAQSELTTARGLSLNADYWHVYGIVVQKAGDNGISVGGSNNVIERVVTRNNRDTGLQISRMASDTPQSDWPSNNLVVSSESHDNVDSDGEDADGFAAKLTVGPGNVFRDTVSHNNIDDGWDLYTKPDTGPIGPVTIEHSLAYENGTLSNGGQAGAGDRNGFKLGGEDIKVNHVVKNSYAVDNGKHGFTFNSNPGSMTISNNVAVGNAQRNFNFDAGTSVFSGNVSCSSGSDRPHRRHRQGRQRLVVRLEQLGVQQVRRGARVVVLLRRHAEDHLRRVHHGADADGHAEADAHADVDQHADTDATVPIVTPTPTSSTPSTGACTARITEVNSWGGGYTASVTVTAGSRAISSWTTSLSLPSGGSVQGWSGTFAAVRQHADRLERGLERRARVGCEHRVRLERHGRRADHVDAGELLGQLIHRPPHGRGPGRT